jgi:membrane-associated protein
VPIVRTFTPIIAGVSGMRYRSFLTFNIIGGILWGAGVTLLGSWLGQVDFVEKNIEAILILIVFLSVVPIIIEFLRARGNGKKNPPEAPAAPAMDDATTQLRRVPPVQHGQDRDQPHGHQDQSYGHRDQQHGHRNQPYGRQDQVYGHQGQAYPQQQPYQPQQRPYGSGGQDYGHQGQPPYAQQHPQPQAQPQQYPQGQQYPQSQGHPYGQDYPQN